MLGQYGLWYGCRCDDGEYAYDDDDAATAGAGVGRSVCMGAGGWWWRVYDGACQCRVGDEINDDLCQGGLCWVNVMSMRRSMRRVMYDSAPMGDDDYVRDDEDGTTMMVSRWAMVR